MLFENFVYRALIDTCRSNKLKIKFWRTKDQAEVDFIVSAGHRSVPFEVKYSKMDSPKTGRSLINYIKQYQPEKAFVVNLTLRETVQVENTQVHFIPYYELFTEELGLFS